MPALSPQDLTAGQVAQLLDVSASTVVRWTREGKLTATRTRVGGWRRYRLQDVEAFIGSLGQEKAS